MSDRLSPDERSFDIGQGPMEVDPTIMDSGRVPVDVYASDEWFARESNVFAKVWLHAGRVERLEKPGDWFLFEMPAIPASIIVVKGRDGEVRAFHNVCSHRGMKLVWNKTGGGGKFSCPYHAWTYDDRGQLAGLPRASAFPCVDRKDSGLTPVHCEVWQGFIFLCLAKTPGQTLREYLGPIPDRLSDIPFGQYGFTAKLTAEVDSNWKFGIEAASESYHVPAVHSATIGTMLNSAENPTGDNLAWAPMGPHRMATIGYNRDYRFPDHRLVQNFAAANVAGMLQTGEEGGGLANHPQVNRAGHKDFGNDQYFLFPNMSIVIAHTGWWYTSYVPLARDRFQWSIVFHYERPRTAREMFCLTQSVVFQRDLLTEDNVRFPYQQELMTSGAKSFFQFGEPELLLRHLHAVMATAIRSTTDDHPEVSHV